MLQALLLLLLLLRLLVPLVLLVHGFLMVFQWKSLHRSLGINSGSRWTLDWRCGRLRSCLVPKAYLARGRGLPQEARVFSQLARAQFQVKR